MTTKATQKAFIKLAQTRLAINYVLRNRMMNKQAMEGNANLIAPAIGALLGGGIGAYTGKGWKSKLMRGLAGAGIGGGLGVGANYLIGLNEDIKSLISDGEKKDDYINRLIASGKNKDKQIQQQRREINYLNNRIDGLNNGKVISDFDNGTSPDPEESLVPTNEEVLLNAADLPTLPVEQSTLDMQQ